MNFSDWLEIKFGDCDEKFLKSHALYLGKKEFAELKKRCANEWENLDEKVKAKFSQFVVHQVHETEHESHFSVRSNHIQHHYFSINWP